MRIVAPQTINVQCNRGVIAESLEKLVQQIHIKITNACTRIHGMVFKPWTPGEVDNNTRQCLIKRHIGMPVATNAALVDQRLGNCLTERNTDIFNRVVAVNMQVTLAP